MSVFLNFNNSLFDHSSVHVTIGAFFCTEQSPDYRHTREGEKSGAGGGQGGRHGCWIRPTFHLKFLFFLQWVG
jgi:hypothetical protein